MADRLDIVLRGDRGLVLAAIVAMSGLAWGYILLGAGTDMPALDMTAWPTAAGSAMAAMAPAAWTPGYALLMLIMWWLMMVAMMLPSAAPMLLFHAALNRKQRDSGSPHVTTAIFALGYLTVWGGFSLVAVGLQWALQHVALLSPAMVVTSVALGGLLLVAAGIWQLTPLKHACLRHCRSPLAFIMGRWRPGASGAWRMGLEHGAFCLGCCWVLMLLLFYGGVMNVYWIAGLSLIVLAEKTFPAAHWLGRMAGILLVGWGVAVIAADWLGNLVGIYR